MSPFEVGKQVVCIRDNWAANNKSWDMLPVKGRVYTIREIQTLSGVYYPEPTLHLRFYEIRNPVKDYADGTQETAFISHCFRPVKETSIDCFTSILNKLPEKELV